jgi:hypothetical protein
MRRRSHPFLGSFTISDKWPGVYTVVIPVRNHDVIRIAPVVCENPDTCEPPRACRYHPP